MLPLSCCLDSCHGELLFCFVPYVLPASPQWPHLSGPLPDPRFYRIASGRRKDKRVGRREVWELLQLEMALLTYPAAGLRMESWVTCLLEDFKGSFHSCHLRDCCRRHAIAVFFLTFYLCSYCLKDHRCFRMPPCIWGVLNLVISVVVLLVHCRFEPGNVSCTNTSYLSSL